MAPHTQREPAGGARAGREGGEAMLCAPLCCVQAAVLPHLPFLIPASLYTNNSHNNFSLSKTEREECLGPSAICAGNLRLQRDKDRLHYLSSSLSATTFSSLTVPTSPFLWIFNVKYDIVVPCSVEITRNHNLIPIELRFELFLHVMPCNQSSPMPVNPDWTSQLCTPQ